MAFYSKWQILSAQAARAFTFLLQHKKVNKKCRRLTEIPKNLTVRLKSENSLRSNSSDLSHIIIDLRGIQ
jgi:hypothetical protein